MVPKHIPFIPNHYNLVFIAEGAANVVYEIHPSRPTPPSPRQSYIEEYSENTPPPSIVDFEYDDEGEALVDESFFENKLLRLRKDIPTTVPVLEAQRLWERLVKPLFKSHQLVNQELVRLSPGSIIQKLNSELSVLEKAQDRPEKRAGIYLADDDYGLLVTAMRQQNSGDAKIHELKPKWLTQSPSAPPNTVRCRTCALTALRNSKCAPKDAVTTYCPLDLVSKNPSDRIYATKLLLPSCTPPTTISRFFRFLENNPLLSNLRDVQWSLDKLGPLHADTNNEKFRLAMTLRDCSVYIRFPEHEKDDDSKIEARLGDLDVKSAEKGETWKQQEKELIDGGWYTGTERSKLEEITCALGRKFRTEDSV